MPYHVGGPVFGYSHSNETVQSHSGGHHKFTHQVIILFVFFDLRSDLYPVSYTHLLKWHKALGFGDDHYRFHDHDKLAHYANAATDIEFLMPFGFKEVEGIHSRTNFDLSQHETFSGCLLYTSPFSLINSPSFWTDTALA